jgi:hypothetical protein
VLYANKVADLCKVISANKKRLDVGWMFFSGFPMSKDTKVFF